MNSYELYHHGVKGQKWGVRRYQKKYDSLKRKRDYNETYSKALNDTVTGYKKNIKELKRNGVNTKRADLQDSIEDRFSGHEAAVGHKLNKSQRNLLAKSVVDHEISTYNRLTQTTQEKIKETMRANKVYDRALSDLSEKQIKTGKVLVDKTTKASLKDVKTYDKYGIAIDRDAEYRVTGISASNVDMRKLKRIKKIQRKVARNGDY